MIQSITDHFLFELIYVYLHLFIQSSQSNCHFGSVKSNKWPWIRKQLLSDGVKTDLLPSSMERGKDDYRAERVAVGCTHPLQYCN